MPQVGRKGVRAAWADAQTAIARALAPEDPPPQEKRGENLPGQWPGAPVERMPPGSGVVPLGVDGHVSYYIDTLGQVLGFDGLDKKRLIRLYRTQPNFLYWAWPRFSDKAKGTPRINGLEVDDAVQCLEKAAGLRGLFSPADRVRGRGAWTIAATADDRHAPLIWHSGDALWRVRNGRLQQSPPGELGGLFYPRRPPVMTPWPEPVAPDDSPAPGIFRMLQTWSFQRGALDAVLAIGGMGVMLIGGALRHRPHFAAMGDFGVGKSELNGLIKGVVGEALLDCANTTEAGIRQRMAFDTLPVAIDEFEGSEDNRRVKAIVDLARVAYSGGRVLRGGSDHTGVEFLARSTFFASGINLPPMSAADRSRFAILNLGELDAQKIGERPVIRPDDGRMLLRALMDGWEVLPARLADWEAALAGARLTGRAQDTFGTLFAIAEILLGYDLMKEAGLPLDDRQALGEVVAKATAAERALLVQNWRGALEHMLQVPIDAWKGGEKPSVGRVIEELEADPLHLRFARERLAAAGLGIRELSAAEHAGAWRAIAPERPPPAPRKSYFMLAVPVTSAALAPLFAGTKWSGGGWAAALEQGPPHVVRRDAGVQRTVKINRVPTWCLLIDLAAYDQLTAEGGDTD